MAKKELDKLFGISENLDTFLNSLSVETISDSLKENDEQIGENIYQIDQQISAYNINGLNSIDSLKIENSLKEIGSLINDTKDIIRHVRDSIVSSELCDAEVIQAFAKLIESAHITLTEYVNLYKTRMQFYDKIRLQILQQQQKIELLKLKYDLDIKKHKKLNEENTIPADMVTYSQEDIVKMLDENDLENNLSD